MMQPHVASLPLPLRTNVTFRILAGICVYRCSIVTRLTVAITLEQDLNLEFKIITVKTYVLDLFKYCHLFDCWQFKKRGSVSDEANSTELPTKIHSKAI